MDAGDRIFEHRWQFYDGQHVIFEPENMTPLELQTEIVNGYRSFYSLRRSLRFVVRLQFLKLLEHLWGWVYIHRWQKEPANRTFIQGLAERSEHTPGAGAPQAATAKAAVARSR